MDARLALSLSLLLSTFIHGSVGQSVSKPKGYSSCSLTFRTIKTWPGPQGINMYFAEAGVGSKTTVVFLHGFPDFWYTWRNQLPAVCAKGYHVVAPDLRGYGGTDKPQRPEDYTYFKQVGDVIGLIEALNQTKVVLVGHDWGATLAWFTALFRPDRVQAVFALSVGFFPVNPQGDFLSLYKAAGLNNFYMFHFQDPAGAELEWAAYGFPARAFKALFLGEPLIDPYITKPTLWDQLSKPVEQIDFKPWFTMQDLDKYVAAFANNNMTGPFNYYRHIGLSWQQQSPWFNAIISPSIPAFYIYGSNDLVPKFPGTSVSLLKNFIPGLMGSVNVTGAGHNVHWQNSDLVNTYLCQFLAQVAKKK